MTAYLLLGDCGEVLRDQPAESVDLIFTSPPYADQRKAAYGGIRPADYVDWFLPRSAEFLRVLKPSGSFVLNIKERVVNGERSTYVLELILALRRQGWRWTEEYIWHKRNSHPGKWPNRFRDNWERLLHFTRQKSFYMDQEAVMVPVGGWAARRLAHLSATDRVRDPSRVGSGFGKRVANWVGRERVYPSNVLHLATECGNQGHAASFPLALPAWFIRLLTRPGDWVLDPFVGSGTTCVAAQQLGRSTLGIDTSLDFIELARQRVVEEGSRREHPA